MAEQEINSVPTGDQTSTTERVKDRVKHAAEHTRDRVHHAADAAKQSSKRAAGKAEDVSDSNPLLLLAGGIAVGAIAGALLPRLDVESEYLAPVGKRLNAAAIAAAAAARDAGREELDARGVNRDAAQAQVNRLIDNVAKAASTAGKAAADAAIHKN